MPAVGPGAVADVARPLVVGRPWLAAHRVPAMTVEDVAIARVIELERRAGRSAVDARRRPGFPADIDSPPRVIEVKACGRASCRGDDLWLEPSQVAEARSNPDFFLYLVENVSQGDAEQITVKVLGGEQLKRLLPRARENHYYELPLPTGEYDAAPLLDGGRGTSS